MNEIFFLVFFISSILHPCDDFIFVHPDKGYISSTEDTDTLYIRTNISPVYITFRSDTGMQLQAGIYDENADMLGFFELQKKEIVKLKGTGKFMITLFTETGSGAWRCIFSSDRKELSGKAIRKNSLQDP